MNSDEAKQQALGLFKPNGPAAKIDYEARSREIRRKIEYLRSLRLAAPAPGTTSKSAEATD